MEAKRNLQLELASVVKTTLRFTKTGSASNAASADAIQPTDEPLSSDLVSAICNVVEAIFVHGLKDVYFVNVPGNTKYSEPNFWPFVSKFAHRNTMGQIKRMNMIKSDIGRSRAWVRISLNEGVMEHYISAFVRERHAVRQFYHRYAFLRDSEQIDILINYMKVSGLSRVPLNLPVNSSFLNSWTPTPLKLAGVMTEGGNMRVRGMSMVQMDEIPEDDVCLGVSALEFDGIDETAAEASMSSTPSLSAPVSQLNSSFAPTSDDDACSSISHMSLVNDRFNEVIRQLNEERTAAKSRSTATTGSTTSDAEEMNNSGNSEHGGHEENGKVVVHRKPKHDSTSYARHSRPRRSHRKRKPQNLQAPATSDNDQIGSASVDSSTPNKTTNNSEEQMQNGDVGCDQDSSTVVDSTVVVKIVEISNSNERNHGAEVVTTTRETETVALTTSVDSGTESGGPAIFGKLEQQNTINEIENAEMPTEPMRKQEQESDDNVLLFATDSSPQLKTVGEYSDSETTSRKASADLLEASSSSMGLSPPERSFSPGNSLRGRMWSDNERDVSSDFNRSTFDSSVVDKTMSNDEHASFANYSFSTVLKSALEESDRHSLPASSSTLSQPMPSHSHSAEEFSAGSPRRNADGTMNQQSSFADAMNNEQVEYAHAIGSVGVADHDDQPSTSSASAGASSKTNERSKDISPDSDFVVIGEGEVSAATSEWQSANALRMRQLCQLPMEGGLDQQQYKCPTCRCDIGFDLALYRVCSFDGASYCHECHRNDLMQIPAQLIFNWNLQPLPVSRASRAFLDHIADRPLIRLDQCNPTLYEYVNEMRETKMLREKLSLVAMYLLTCKESVAEDLRKRLWPKEYLFDDVHLYSINDMLAACSGTLQRHLRSVLSHATQHVADCRLCAQKGFVCELCAHPQIIYPFQMDTTYRCEKCYSVYHQLCMRGRICPKCQRREVYEKQRSERNPNQEHMNLPIGL